MLWRYPVGTGIVSSIPYKRQEATITSSPVIVGDVVYFGANDGFLYALEVNRGTLVWRYRLGVPIASTVAVSGNAVIVAAWDGTVYAFTSDAKGRTQVNAPARPLCVAHRGFSWVAPENTLAAYRMAMEAGAAMGECDVHLTKDGVPILLHDDTLQRTAGSAARPGDLTLAEIKTLDAGAWKSPQFAGERVPTLSEVLQLVKGRMRLAIEIKEPSIARVVVDCIRAGGASSQDAIVFSFHSGAVEEVVRLAPSLATLLLVENLGEDRAAWAVRLAEAVRVRASGVGVAASQTGSEFVQMAHKAGLSVFVYTVNEPRDMSSLAGLGVDAIITDRPDLLLKTLAVR